MSFMKMFYYYLRDSNRQPFGCVCFGSIDEERKFCRGISLCSDKEPFLKSKARNMARGRLISAAINRRSTQPINYDYDNGLHVSIANLTMCKDIIPPPFLFKYKSDYGANLTPFECEIIKDENII